MSDGATVDMAASWADALVRSESRGPGDLDNAMRRVARKTGLPHALFWKLRYRRPKDVMASAFFTLRDAYRHECARQQERLAHEIELTRAVVGADDALVLAAEAVVAPVSRRQALTDDPPR
jgi:hypothetical protein